MKHYGTLMQGSGRCQWLRLQLTSGLDDDGKTDTLAYMDEVSIEVNPNISMR